MQRLVRGCLCCYESWRFNKKMMSAARPRSHLAGNGLSLVAVDFMSAGIDCKKCGRYRGYIWIFPLLSKLQNEDCCFYMEFLLSLERVMNLWTHSPLPTIAVFLAEVFYWSRRFYFPAAPALQKPNLLRIIHRWSVMRWACRVRLTITVRVHLRRVSIAADLLSMSTSIRAYRCRARFREWPSRWIRFRKTIFIPAIWSSLIPTASRFPMSAFMSITIILFMHPVSALEKCWYPALKIVIGKSGLFAHAVHSCRGYGAVIGRQRRGYQ